MIEIINVCPVCRTTAVFKFRKEDQDIFDGGPWSVPCGDCQERLLDRIKSVNGANAYPVYVNLLFGCQTGCNGCVDIARHLTGGNGAAAFCQQCHLPGLPLMDAKEA